MARRQLYNLPFDVLECDSCAIRSPLDVPTSSLDDWLIVRAGGGETHLCPDCRGSVTARRFSKPALGADDRPAPLS
jgi:hypothetical protein